MKMIKITETRYIIPDGVQYIVSTKYKDKEGNDAYRSLSYHSKLKSALMSIIKSEAVDSMPDGETSLYEFIRAYDAMAERVEKALEGAGEI